MAFGFLPRPGTNLGPCTDDCDHTDCAHTKAQAATLCPYCKEQIGFERAFCNNSDGEISHLACLEDHIEKEKMHNLSTGVESTLGNYLQLCIACFGETSKSAEYFRGKIKEDPKAADGYVIAPESQVMLIIMSMEGPENNPIAEVPPPEPRSFEDRKPPNDYDDLDSFDESGSPRYRGRH
jgi:hypothetical protein